MYFFGEYFEKRGNTPNWRGYLKYFAVFEGIIQQLIDRESV